MKFLKIENHKGQFIDSNGEYKEIDKITKEDILNLIDKVISDEEEFEMDEFSESAFFNEAHKIIYNNLYKKFNDLYNKKDLFKEQSEKFYSAALEKYSNN